MSIKRIIKLPLKIAKKTARGMIDRFEDIASSYDLSKWERKGKTKGPIRTAFIVQMPEIWDKLEPVYLSMKDHQDFKTELLVVPPYDTEKKKVNTDFTENYFLEKYDDAIPAFQDGRWISLKDRADYVFYQRPYDSYLPKELRSSTARRYAKCCYIPYGLSMSDSFNALGTNKRFFRNIYFDFPDTERIGQLLCEKFKNDKIHHIEFLGYPALEKYFEFNNEESLKSVMWSPRWSYDPLIGGSRFLEYRETIVKIKESFPDDKLIFRPHPLLFGELENKNLMTKQEAENYLSLISIKKIEYDTGKPIEEAFKDTGILITDISSIISMFFVTGRPIIYCEAGIELNEFYQKMSEGFYIAHDENELMTYVCQLKEGKDPLYETRQRIINDYFSSYRTGTESIVERIRKDHGAVLDR